MTTVHDFRAGDGGLTLFCIPHAGGGASAFRGWAPSLASRVRVRVLQLAGRESRFREPASDDVRAVVADLWNAAAPDLRGPFAIFGHSLGGLLAFELAHEIRVRTGREPERLFVAAARPPHEAQVDAPFSHYGDAEFVDEIVRRYDGIPPAIRDDPEYLAHVVATMRHDIRLLERYRASERALLTCPISAFGGALDDVVPMQSLGGWVQHTTGEFTLDMLRSGHFLVQAERDRLVALVIARLRSSSTTASHAAAPVSRLA